MKKFKLTANTKINDFGITLYQIECTVAIEKYDIKVGDLGGWIESEHVNGNARISNNAWVFGNAQIFGNARVFGNTRVFGDALVFGNARVFGDALVYGNA